MHDLLIAVLSGEQILLDAVTVVADQGVRPLEDMRLAAVILIEDDRLTAFEIALKVHDDIHIGAPPCIDGLVRIAHHAQLRLRRAEQLDDVILQLVDILELIHMDVIKAALPLLADPLFPSGSHAP